MKILLAAINAKYIHSNPAVHSLRAAAGLRGGDRTCTQILVGEYTINHTIESVRADIFRQHPDVLAFSCYIWNISYVRELIRDLSRLLPAMEIWLGGPEVSYHPKQILAELPRVKGILVGPGEGTFRSMAEVWDRGERDYEQIPGLVFRHTDGSLRDTGAPEVIPLAELPFWYQDLTEFENRIIYYESSRGCPFSCSYCLSSIDRTLQFRRVDQVCEELQFFLEHRVPQVKFIDRTFNCRESHALAIWRYIAEHDNKITNFHFEIAADLLTDAEMNVLSTMRPGLVQLEIGVQSANPDTVHEIRRTMNLSLVAERVGQINSFHNIHQHLDLIAGLPFEDYDSFGRSFDVVYAMEPEQLQLGFLKVLNGAYMETMAKSYGLIATTEAPYEVMATRWLPYEDVLRLKGIEEMVEMYYNSGQFITTLKRMVKEVGRPFRLYERLAEFWQLRGFSQIQSSRIRKYEILLEFIHRMVPDCEDEYRRLLTHDCYLRENVKSRPAFAPRQRETDWQLFKDFLQNEVRTHDLLEGFDGVSYREMMGKLHGEFYEADPHGELEGPVMVVYDYCHRDPLTGNARIFSMRTEVIRRKCLPHIKK